MTSQFVSLNKFFRLEPNLEVDPEWLQAVATKNTSAIVNLLYNRLEGIDDVDSYGNQRGREAYDNSMRASKALGQLKDVEIATNLRNWKRRVENERRDALRNEDRVANETRADRALDQLRNEEMYTNMRNQRRRIDAQTARLDAEIDEIYNKPEFAKITGGKSPRRRRSSRRSRK
jgi:hypothetical protein